MDAALDFIADREADAVSTAITAVATGALQWLRQWLLRQAQSWWPPEHHAVAEAGIVSATGWAIAGWSAISARQASSGRSVY